MKQRPLWGASPSMGGLSPPWEVLLPTLGVFSLYSESFFSSSFCLFFFLSPPPYLYLSSSTPHPSHFSLTSDLVKAIFCSYIPTTRCLFCNTALLRYVIWELYYTILLYLDLLWFFFVSLTNCCWACANAKWIKEEREKEK